MFKYRLPIDFKNAMIEAEIKFYAPAQWIKQLVESHSARIKIRDIRTSEGKVNALIDLFTPEGVENSEPAFSVIDNKSGHFSFIGEHHSLGIVDVGDCPVCNAFPRWDIFLIDAFTTEGGDIIMRTLVPDEKTITDFLLRLQKDGVRYQLLKKLNLTRRKDITARQEFVVHTALELGYFDYPKKINLEGLSFKLNVSYVTLAEILRRAEKNIISAYFQQKN